MSLNLNQNFQTIVALALFSLVLLPFKSAIAATPASPSISASGYLLLDMHSNTVIAEKNAHLPLEPASLTKIMTAYTVFKEIKDGNLALTDKVLVSKKAWKTPGSRMFIEVDKRILVSDLIKGMIIQSGNDACVALAEHIAGDEATFANLMNVNAKKLGMTSSNFVNSTGLPDEGHKTTAADIAKVTAATIKNFPEFYKLYSQRQFTFNKIKQNNRNRLLWRDSSIDGVKTGHTEAAGYCLVASGVKENMRLISVILGTQSDKDRISQSQTLLNYGFRFFESHRLYGATDKVTDTKVWKGQRNRLNLGLTDDLYISIPRNRYKDISAQTTINTPVEAPVNLGDTLGSIRIELDGKLIAERPLVAIDAMARGGIIDVVVDSTLMLFK